MIPDIDDRLWSDVMTVKDAVFKRDGIFSQLSLWILKLPNLILGIEEKSTNEEQQPSVD